MRSEFSVLYNRVSPAHIGSCLTRSHPCKLLTQQGALCCEEQKSPHLPCLLFLMLHAKVHKVYFLFYPVPGSTAFQNKCYLLPQVLQIEKCQYILIFQD